MEELDLKNNVASEEERSTTDTILTLQQILEKKD
jgi:hypothetical protein